MFNYYEIHNYELEVVHQHRAVKYDTHLHDELEIIYVSRGEQGIIVSGTPYTLHESECIAVFPNIPHSYTRPDNIPKHNSGADSVIIFIPSAMLYSLYPDMYGAVPEKCILEAGEVSDTARLCFKMIIEEKALNAQIGWAQVILSHILPGISVNKISAGNNPEIISMIMKYVSENYLESLTLDLLADNLGISKYKISRIFTDKIKMSFRAYLGMLRANHAARLINMSDTVLTETARLSGFESTRSFYRVGKEVYGISPAEYRKLVRK